MLTKNMGNNMWTKPDNIWLDEKRQRQLKKNDDYWELSFFVSGRGWEWACNLEYDKEKNLLMLTGAPNWEFFPDDEYDKFKAEGLPIPSDWSPPGPEYEWVPRPQKDWEKTLIAKYPHLYDAEMRFDLDGDGWRNLVEEFSADLDKIVPKDQKISVSVKTKYARLTIYIWADGKFKSHLDGLADDYAEKSMDVCETCGEPGSWDTINDHWEYITCPAHRGHDPRDNERDLWKGYGHRLVKTENQNA